MVVLMVACAPKSGPNTKNKRKPVVENVKPSGLDIIRKKYPNARVLGERDKYSFIVIEGNGVLLVEVSCTCGGESHLKRITPLPEYQREISRDTIKME